MNVRNYIHLTGNIGADPKTAILPSGDLVCEFSIATNDYYRNKQGERVTQTEWHRVKAYGKLAGVFAEHLEKGSQLSLIGSMTYSKWEDKFGQKRTSAVVVAREFSFLGSRRRDDAAAATEATEPHVAAQYGEYDDPVLEAEIEAIVSETHTSAKPTSATGRKTRSTGKRRTNAPAAGKTGKAAV